MLRASSLGLTHGISRFSLLQRHRFLHKQLGHDPVLLVFGIPRSHSTTEAKVVKKTTVDQDSTESHISHRFPTHLPSPETNTSTPEVDSKTPSSSRADNTTREVDNHRKAARHLRSKGTVKRAVAPQPVKKRGLRPHIVTRWAFEEHRRRRPLYEQLAAATDIDEAWQTYQQLLSDCPPHVKQPIPQKSLHCFAALLVAHSRWQPAHKTRTQTVFHRLLSVLNTIYYTGGQVRLWEWNALLECSGRGWRRTRLEDFHSALNIYRDMMANRAPGASLSDDTFAPLHDESRVACEPVRPDIVTYTTLLAIASRTLSEPVLQQAEELLVSSGFPPNRITYLAYIRYYTRKGRMTGVRSVVARMKLNGLELGIDGLNACIWAYGRNGRLDVATLIYRILRHHLLSQHGQGRVGEIDDAVQDLAELEGITVPVALKPDAVTYYTLIQTYAYHGRAQRCLAVFKDMMTSPEPVTGPLDDMHGVLSEPTIPNPVLPIFRAIFLGFARHAELPGHPNARSTRYDEKDLSDAWSLEQLHTLFEHFIGLPQDAKPNSRTAYWLLVAYAITSGYDRVLLRQVWERLAARYGTWWDGRVHEFRNKIYAEHFDEAYFEQVRAARER
ncbi:hypothetical protein C8Q76DRAFT_855241 [Earliella scabrosa]|nr:hypothetical protein C8Q76DRAFT_855241 [Earliella scabrosa]